MMRDAAEAMVPPPALIIGPPSRSRRRWINLAICIFLLGNVIVPLSYYLQSDIARERFAWRMFSSVHLSRWACQATEYSIDGRRRVARPIALPRQVVRSTQRQLETGQRDVVGAFMRHWLAHRPPEVVGVTLDVGGTWPDGSPLPAVRYEMRRGEPTLRRSEILP